MWVARFARGLAGGVGLFVMGLGSWGPAPLGSLGWAAPQDEISRRDFAISGFKPPPRWEVLPNERRSYPQLLAWASRSEGDQRSVITLVGKRLAQGATLKEMIDETAALSAFPRAQNLRLQQQFSPGWTSNQRVQLDAVLAATKSQHAQTLRQFFYLNAPFAYVLTLVCPQEQAAARYRDLEDTAANLVPLPTTTPAVIPPVPAAAPPATAPAAIAPPAIAPPATASPATAPRPPMASPAPSAGSKPGPASAAPRSKPPGPRTDGGVSDLR